MLYPSPFRLFAISLLLLLIGSAELHGAHIYGADITHECLNACTTRVHLRVYRNCTGGPIANTNVIWKPAQSGCTLPMPLAGWSLPTTIEITPLCPTAASACTQSGAPIGGYEEAHWVRDYNVCAGPPCDFRLVFSDCCRNPSITSFANVGTQMMTISDTWIRTGLSGCNSSPQFRHDPLTYICAGQTYDFDMGASDPDGDSLVHSLSTCYDMDSVPATYNPSFSPSSPLGPNYAITMDPATGMTSLVASTNAFVVGPICMTVDEYRNGQWIGRVQRDIMVTVVNCPANQVPTLQPLTNLSANATAIGNTVSVCGSGSVCFDVVSADVNPSQNIVLTWDMSLPGATFSQIGMPSVTNYLTGTGAVPPSGRFCWTPPGPGRYVVHFRALDDACPLIGYAHKTVLIEVANGAYANATPGTCPSVDFSAGACLPGSYTYAWSGDAGFSSTLQNPSFTYPAIGDYAWQVIVSGSGLQDTIRDTVHVLADTVHLPTLYVPDSVQLGPCLGASSATLSMVGNYAAYLTSNNTTLQTIVVNQPATYIGIATDFAGCAFWDSVVVTWTDPDIGGTVLTSAAPQLVNQKIYLIRYDSVAQALSAIDSAYTDASGYYYFCGVTDTIVYLKAAPDSAAYPMEMPTYADTALFWSQALAFYPLPGIPLVHNFATKAGANPGGPGFIGGLITQGANKASAVGDPVPGLTVFLKEALSGAVFAVARTDANGYFRFGNLPLGDYKVIPDKPLVSIVNVPQVSITAQVPTQDSLDFRLNATFLELHVASGVATGPLASDWTVTPNPFSGEAALRVKLASPGTLSWQVLDVLGKVVDPGQPAQTYPVGLHTWHLAQDLAPGIYFVELDIDGQASLKKMLKVR